jgi:SAM-dependent methyltransferase
VEDRSPDPPESAGLPAPRWFRERTPQEREGYAQHFRRLAARGEDVDGEARFVDAMLPRGADVLDAGCGVGRVAAALASWGHPAAGVDADPVLIEAGRSFYPDLPLAALDLCQVSPAALEAAGLPSAYDVIVAAGNVMLFVAEGTEGLVLQRLASVLRPAGRAVFGFRTGAAYTHDDLDRDAAALGWVKEHRFATWHLDAFSDTADWAVSVYRADRRSLLSLLSRRSLLSLDSPVLLGTGHFVTHAPIMKCAIHRLTGESPPPPSATPPGDQAGCISCTASSDASSAGASRSSSAAAREATSASFSSCSRRTSFSSSPTRARSRALSTARRSVVWRSLLR